MIRGAFLILHHDDRAGHDAGRRKEIGRALITGISTGQGSARIADQIMQAAQILERRALLIARTEINRAYRQSNWNQMRSSRAVLGYRRMCYPDTACFACLMLDKDFYPIDSEPCDHPNGKCSFVPVTRHYDPGNDPNWQGGREYFDSLPEDAQRKLMGPGRFDLWKQGGVDPRDMVYIKPNQTWGGSPAIKAVESLKRIVSIPASITNIVSEKEMQEEMKKEIVDNGKKSLLFFSTNDPLFEYAKSIKRYKDYQDIFIHGGDTGFMFKIEAGEKREYKTNINVKELSEYVKESAVYTGGKIRLASCETGNINAKTAQRFADEMGVEVLAPTENANLWYDYLRVFDEEGNEGEWREFSPDK